jgi:hypothetical protein
MRLVGIPVSSDKLKVAQDAFHAVIADSSARPLYVCDDTGEATGALWYAYFRTVEALSSDAAKVRVSRLGKIDTNLGKAVDEQLKR